ncbi:MAG: hypothetical protein ACRDOK_25010 [Streptosporangiaceae bacterium]
MPERAAAESAPASPPASNLAAVGAGMTARRMWTLFEPEHTVSYLAPEPRQAFERVRLRGFGLAPAASVAVVDRLADVAADLGAAGHVLGAANGELPVPDEPLARRWNAASTRSRR